MQKGFFKKLSALLFSLIFPVAYFLVRYAVQLASYLWSVARIRARSPELEEEWVRNQAQLWLRTAAPWLLIVSALLTLLLAAVLFRLQGTSLARVVGVEKPKKVLNLCETGLGLNLALSMLISLLPLPASWFSEHTESVSDPLGAAGTAVMVLCTVIAAPLVEEVVFRGLCFRFLQRGFSPVIALLWQAVLFSAFHGTKLQMLYVFPAAVVLGLVYKRFGTLTAPVVLHMAFNAFSFAGIQTPSSLWGKWLCFLLGAGITALGLRGAFYKLPDQSAAQQ